MSAAGGPDLYIDTATFRETFYADLPADLAAPDQAINPDTERFTANRMGGTVGTIQASHVAFISRPVETAAFIMAALP
jgi:hypothetical protein